jgi:Ca-activated chloride channel family protein
MAIGADDPRLTAYALGELDPSERAEVERLLAGDPAAQAALAEVRQTVSLLGHGLAAEAAPVRLAPLQRVRLEAQAGQLAGRRAGWQGARWWFAAASAVAAGVLLIVGYATLHPHTGGRTGLPGQGGQAGGGHGPVAVATPPDGRSGTATTGAAAHPAGTPPNNIPAPSRVVGPWGWGAHAPPGQAGEQAFQRVAAQPVVPLPLDAGEGSYAFLRRMLTQEGRLPARDAVRVEEMINYFPYDYRESATSRVQPLAVHAEVAGCPWNAGHRLLRVALKGRDLGPASAPAAGGGSPGRPAADQVFLVDVSGSMARPGRLPLVKAAMKALLGRLTAADRVAIVIYAGECGVLLDATPGDRKDEILAAIETLHAGGSTEGPSATLQAYELAERHFIRGGVNRVIVCTDDDFNVGMGSDDELVRLVEDKAAAGVSLSVLGFAGDGRCADRMRALAQAGGGDWACIETHGEVLKALADQLSGSGTPVARAGRAEVVFNPAKVEAYRVIGYDAPGEELPGEGGEAGLFGAGQAATVLYEIIPARSSGPASGPAATSAAPGQEMCTVKVRYESPTGEAAAAALACPVVDRGQRLDQASEDFRFAAAVASFGLILRDSKSTADVTLDTVLQQAKGALGADPFGLRAEFLRVVDAARRIQQAR